MLITTKTVSIDPEISIHKGSCIGIHYPNITTEAVVPLQCSEEDTRVGSRYTRMVCDQQDTRYYISDTEPIVKTYHIL